MLSFFINYVLADTTTLDPRVTELERKMTNVGIAFRNLCTILEYVKTPDDPDTTEDESINLICCSNQDNAAMYCATSVSFATNFGIQNQPQIGTCDLDSTASICNA